MSPGDQHVIPLDDLLDHQETPDCWCDPKVEVVGANLLVIHNSFDGREFREPDHEPYRAPHEGSE